MEDDHLVPGEYFEVTSHVDEHRKTLLKALDKCIEQGLIEDTDEVAEYRANLNAVPDEQPGMLHQIIWPRKPYPFEPWRNGGQIKSANNGDNDRYHCKNRDYTARPFTKITSDETVW